MMLLFFFTCTCRSPPWRSAWLALCLAGMFVAPVASAAEPGDVRLGVFGTLGYAADNRSDMAAARDITQSPNDGYATGASWKIDSRLGAQAEYAVSASVDLVGQVVWRDHFESDLDSSTEMAYVSLSPDASSNIRLGRINYDAFLMSDHRNVGYAYVWVRPPLEFYGWIPIFSVNGLDGRYDLGEGDVRWRIKAQAGTANVSLPIRSGYHFEARDLFGLSVSRQAGDLRLKAAYSRFRVESEVPDFVPLHAGLDQLAAAGLPGVSGEAADLRKNLTFKGAQVTYATIGASYDDRRWLLQGELGQSTATATAIPHGRTGYVSVGRHVGSWTPFLNWSFSRPRNDLRIAQYNWGGFNSSLRDPALFVVNATRMEQQTISVGTRWDFHAQAALKVQWDHTEIERSGYGLWWRSLGLNDQATRVNLLSATLDFAF